MKWSKRVTPKGGRMALIKEMTGLRRKETLLQVIRLIKNKITHKEENQRQENINLKLS